MRQGRDRDDGWRRIQVSNNDDDGDNDDDDGANCVGDGVDQYVQ